MNRVLALVVVLSTFYYFVDVTFVQSYKREQSAECVRYDHRYQQKVVNKNGVKYIDKFRVDFCAEKKYPNG